MTPEYYNDSKTYNHDELCRDNYDTIYRASCTNLAMRGIPPDGNNIGNFWIEVEKERSSEYIDGQELVVVTEDEDDVWKSFFLNIDKSKDDWASKPPKNYRKFLKQMIKKCF